MHKAFCASKHTQADRQTLCRLLQCVMMMLMMIVRTLGREKACMCVYSQWGEKNGKRETSVPPAVTLHNDIIIDFHQHEQSSASIRPPPGMTAE